MTSGSDQSAPRGGVGGLARQAARRLRDIILPLPDGTRLGSEEEMRERLDVSRAILRQAARILEHEQLLVVRRGVGGGFFVRHPSVQAVTRAATSYLQARDATIGDTVRIARVFAVEIAELAAQADNAVAREKLQVVRRTMASIAPDAFTSSELLRSEALLVDALIDLADTPVLGLFQQILHEFGRQDRRLQIYRGRPDRCAEWRRQRLMLIDAVLAHDAEMAALLARRQNEMSQAWISADAPPCHPAHALGNGPRS